MARIAASTIRGPASGEKLPGGRSVHRGLQQNVQSRWPSGISKVLRDECNVQHKAYALLVIDDDGKSHIFASPSLEPYRDRIFPVNVREDVASIVSGIYSELDRPPGLSNPDGEHEVDDASVTIGHEGTTSRGHSPFDRRPSMPSKINTRDVHSSRAVKRRRSSADFYGSSAGMDRTPSDPADDSDSGGVEDTNPNNKVLYLANTEVVDQFFETRFKQLQQLVCKVVAKAWIKVIEPKKQTNFPYNKGNDKKPPWWPDDVKHKEPDHLMKPERLKLVMTLLRLRKVPIEKLEAATKEVSGNIPKDKQPLLAEIYKVAKMEERYLNGELSHDACTWVAASDSILMSPKQKVASPPSERDDLSNRGFQRKQRGSGQSGVDESPSTLVSPVGNMGLQGSQEAMSIRSKSTDSTNNPDIPFSGLPRSTAGSTRSIITSSGYPQYVQPQPMEEPQHFIANQGMSMSGGYPYVQRSGYGPSSPMQPIRRANTFHSPHTPPPTGMYEGWPSQMPNNLMGNQMFNAYTGSDTPPSQAPGPQQYQLLPPLNNTALPPLHQQHQGNQGIVADRGSQQYESQTIPHPQLRTGSLSHPHQPPHSMLDFQNFAPTRGYGSLGSNEHAGGLVDELKRDRMGGN